MKYAAGEFMWYFSGDRSIDFIMKYSRFWGNITNEKTDGSLTVAGGVNSNYGHLAMVHPDASWKGHHVPQWVWALESMIKDPDTRQAIIHINRPDHQHDWIKDFPCTLSFQFFLRDDKLHAVYTMRSNDLIFGLSFDFPMFAYFQEVFLHNLKTLDDRFKDVELGHITITAGSSHIYERDYDVVEKMIDNLSPVAPVPLERSPVIAIRDADGHVNLNLSFSFTELIRFAEDKEMRSVNIDEQFDDPTYNMFAKAIVS